MSHARANETPVSAIAHAHKRQSPVFQAINAPAMVEQTVSEF